ncbi:MAG TPA: bifunctional isocitrate dehydrogenase kinase/phosphatase [Acidimicrobiia bacterium]|nr:bifunctional isocitrate dehydrogenase kinase/phosphatase [Acidimicrobiia bacterium]
MTLTERRSASFLANEGAAAIEEAFRASRGAFVAVTRRASERFTGRDWHGSVADATHRLDVYDASVWQALEGMRAILGDRIDDRIVWAGIKAVYSGHIAEDADWQLAETFFNSLTRRVFTTAGVDPDIEFVDTDWDRPPPAARSPVHAAFEGANAAALIDGLLDALGPDAPYADRDGDVAAAARRLAEMVPAGIDRVEAITALFYRRTAAYLVGRLITTAGPMPLVLAFAHTEEGVRLDAVLTSEDEVSILFSFTRSPFLVDVEPAHALVEFLRGLLPRKRTAELYMAVGHHKHGKTVLYRDLVHHLASTDERFDHAPGTPGMVMVVFTMDGFDIVFKVIRDHLPPQKRITRQTVRDRYRLVFGHDRAGRLVEAQEFEHLRLRRDRFTDRLAAELLDQAARTVHEDGEYLVIEHAYLERRVTPLDVHLAGDPEGRDRVIDDFGRAIEDLAVTGVFPGDLLPKNFGVTRHGRVVSYDYDELELLERMCFRAVPEPTNPDDEFSAEPWYGVRHEDVFPEELAGMMAKPVRAVLTERHPGLFDPAWWTDVQERLAAGELFDPSPYPEHRRLSVSPEPAPDSHRARNDLEEGTTR